MNKPTITIDGKEIQMKSKARLWKTIAKFSTENGKLPIIDAGEKYCEVIATAFGVTTEEVLDNLEIDEVLPKYFEVYGAVADLLTAGVDKKNETAET